MGKVKGNWETSENNFKSINSTNIYGLFIDKKYQPWLSDFKSASEAINNRINK